MRGKWQGSWKMSKSAEKILRRMIQPNADLRCTAPEALQDPYWDSLPVSAHKRAAGFGTPARSGSRNISSRLSPRRVSKTQQSECEHAEMKQDDKENIPVITPNTRKGPPRQRILSGTDGKFDFASYQGSK
jgi:serine/threonine-protein kinase GIN4